MNIIDNLYRKKHREVERIADFISHKVLFFSLVFGNISGWIYAAFVIRQNNHVGDIDTGSQIFLCYFISQYIRLFTFGSTYECYKKIRADIDDVTDGHVTTRLIASFITPILAPVVIAIIYFMIEDIIMRFNKPTEYLDYALIAITAIYNIIFLTDFFKNIKSKIQIYKKNREDNVKSVTRAIGFSIEIIIYFASIILGAYLGLWLLRNHIPVIKTYFPFFN